MAPARRTVTFGKDVGRPHPVLVPEGHFLLRQSNRAPTPAPASPLVPKLATSMKAKTPERRKARPWLTRRFRATFDYRDSTPDAPAPHNEFGNALWDDFTDDEKRYIIDQAIYNSERAEKGRPHSDVFPFDVRNVDIERLLHRYQNCEEIEDDGLDCLLKDMATADEILPSLRDGKARATMSIAPRTSAMSPVPFIPRGICRQLRFWRVGFRLITDHKDVYVTIEVKEQDYRCEPETLRIKQPFESAAASIAAQEDLQERLRYLKGLLRCMTRDPESDGLSIDQIQMLARALGNPIEYGFDVE